MFKMQHIRPMIWTEEVAATVAFYVEKLGFICDEFIEEWQWASLHNHEATLMIAKPNLHTPFSKPHFTGSFYINVQNIDELYAQLKEKKCEFVYEIENFSWDMREFAIYDNNGYILQFGMPLV